MYLLRYNPFILSVISPWKARLRQALPTGKGLGNVNVNVSSSLDTVTELGSAEHCCKQLIETLSIFKSKQFNIILFVGSFT